MKVMNQSELKNVNGGAATIIGTLIAIGAIGAGLQLLWEVGHGVVDGWNNGL